MIHFGFLFVNSAFSLGFDSVQLQTSLDKTAADESTTVQKFGVAQTILHFRCKINKKYSQDIFSGHFEHSILSTPQI